jgi:hypothetical protein
VCRRSRTHGGDASHRGTGTQPSSVEGRPGVPKGVLGKDVGPHFPAVDLVPLVLGRRPIVVNLDDEAAVRDGDGGFLFEDEGY